MFLVFESTQIESSASSEEKGIMPDKTADIALKLAGKSFGEFSFATAISSLKEKLKWDSPPRKEKENTEKSKKNLTRELLLWK